MPEGGRGREWAFIELLVLDGVDFVELVIVDILQILVDKRLLILDCGHLIMTIWIVKWVLRVLGYKHRIGAPHLFRL